MKKKVNEKKESEEEIKRKKKKEQIKTENKILTWFLIAIGAFIVVFLIFFIVGNSQEKFEYRGVNFTVVEFCDSGPPCLITYNTKLPVIMDGRLVDYNFYLRNDPRILEVEVPFSGELNLKDDMRINITYDNICEGKETIAVANFANLFSTVLDTNIEGDEGQGCDLIGNKMYVGISEGEETRIRKFGPACYEIEIKGCEILEGTERFMVETFVELQKFL